MSVRTSTGATHEVKVNFAVVGVMKGGTTALRHFLRQHPDVYLPEVKEVHFFDSSLAFPPWGPMYELYHSCFDGSDGYRAVGDVTPGYMFFEAAVSRMRAYNPALKLIVLLRDPVDRAYSHYVMTKEVLGLEPLPSFTAALAAEPMRLRKADQDDMSASSYRLHSYFRRGLYAGQIERLLEHFPRDQILFLKNEDLRRDHRSTLERTFRFLGVDPSVLPPAASVSTGSYRPLNGVHRDVLRRRYREDLAKVEALLGWDLTCWRGR